MLSLQRTSTPWFVSRRRSLTSSPDLEDEECSLENPNHNQHFGSTGEDDISFRNRFPPLFKKRSDEEIQCDDRNLPSDPRCWSRDDVETWLRFMTSLHSLPEVQIDRFLMNGKALCLMSIEMFCQRVPLGGKLLFKDFQLRLAMAMYNNKNQ